LPVSSGDEDFLEITEYLITLGKTDVYNLGLVLGLSQHKVVAKMDSKPSLMTSLQHGCERRTK